LRPMEGIAKGTVKVRHLCWFNMLARHRWA
jgi:hypothetical protein